MHIDGILPKGPYLPCVSMAGRALLAGYHRYMQCKSHYLPCCSRGKLTLSVSLHSPSGRPAIRVVQGDSQWPLKMVEIPISHVSPLWLRQSQPIFRPDNPKGWFHPIGGHVSCHSSPNATWLGLCSRKRPEEQSQEKIKSSTLDNIATILQTVFWDAFLWMKSFIFWLKFPWSLFLRVHLTITQHWLR